MLWDSFLKNSNQGTFLFQRDFMDYHSDRFQDFSLMIFQDESLVGICPANRNDNEWHSHQGLTYGGIVFQDNFQSESIGDIIKTLSTYLKSKNFEFAFINTIPEFYGNNILLKFKHQLVKQQAQIYRSDMVLAVDYSRPISFHKTKLKHYKRNLSAGFEIRETSDFSSFWNTLLTPRLQAKHNAKPVHSLSEIQYLHSKFPEQIKQFNIYDDEVLLAGITIFDKGKVVKSQYGATNEKGEKCRAIEFLFMHLIKHYNDLGKRYFSMGTVTEQNDLGYNPGLLKQKEELGCSLYLQDFYSLKLT